MGLRHADRRLFGSGLLTDFPAVEAALGFMLPALFMSFLLASFQRSRLA
jgi:predicted branched-subunit amino acid permease